MTKGLKITLICLGIIITPLLLFFALLAFAIGGEFLLVKWEIDNPYVDSHFSHWEEIYIHRFGSFCVPEDWTVTREGEIYTILDDSGEIWAYGCIFDKESKYSDYPSFLSEIYGTRPTHKSKDLLIPFVMMDGSDMDIDVFDFDGSEKAFYSLFLLKNADTEMVWFCPLDLSEQAKQYAIAEALIYSYAFAYAN